MKQFLIKNFPSILVTFLLCTLFITVVIVYTNTVRVDYTVTDADGTISTEIWEKSGPVVSYFDEKRNFIGLTNFSTLDGLYHENRLLLEGQGDEQISTIFLFEKSPEMMTEKETVTGVTTISATSIDHVATLESSMEKVVRTSDGRIICITVYGQLDGPINVITRLYDNVTSTYYQPDEILDQLVVGEEVIRTVHFVAKGRQFLPLNFKHSKKWM